MGPGRFLRIGVFLVGVLVGPGMPIRAQDANACDQPGEAPDLVVADVRQVVRYGPLGDITAYSFGNVHCNVGTCWANFFQATNQHPVVAQNLFRLKGGRFEQIGQSWVLHTFFALANNFCSTQCLPATGTHLGVNCSDDNTAGIQGGQSRLGPKSEVNAFNGVFAMPFGTEGQTGNGTYKRLQAHAADLEPDLNAGADYFAEIQIVAADDAGSGHGKNNCAYRPVTLTESTPGTYNLTLTGVTQTRMPALEAWKVADPDVVVSEAPVPGDGTFFVGAKATPLGQGLWRYEYAVQNVNAQRSASSFRVPLPLGAIVGNAGFHDVDYHSGELFEGTDWTASVDAGAVTWSTQPFTQNPNANALRWGTLYNFRFDAVAAPVAGRVTLGLFQPGTPEAVSVTTIAPTVCDGNAVCDPGENPCACPVDCGPPPVVELSCGDGADNDCDGSADCRDPDCCGDPGCAGPDADADGFAACDCNDADPLVWLTPGETAGLRLSRAPAGSVLDWSPPSEAGAGAGALSYDVLRSPNPASFVAGTSCLPDADPADVTLTDPDEPASGTAFYYEVRARNACPHGEGELGRQANGIPRAGRSCP